MAQKLMIVALSVVGPIIGSVIGVMKKPSTVYILNMLYFAAGGHAGYFAPNHFCTDRSDCRIDDLYFRQ